MADQLIVSIDCSTTACKAIAWDRSGRPVAAGRASYPIVRPEPTWAEQDAEEWWRSTCRALRECVAQVDAGRIIALGITHQRESFVPVDKEGRPLRHAILWLDERSRQEVAWMETHFGRDALHRLTGKPPSMTQSLPKLIWLRRHEPEIAQRAYKLLDVFGFLLHRLTGAWRTSLACADPMGVVDMVRGVWAEDLIRAIGLDPEQFVEMVAPGAIAGRINAAAAAATGLPVGLPVIAGAGDGQCAGLGANAIAPSQAYLNLGTAVASGTFSPNYLVDEAFRTLYAPEPGAYFLEHILRGGTYTVSWFVEQFAADLTAAGVPAEDQLEAAARRLPPGAQGLMLVPYWNTVMSPYWDPAATGITIGWTGVHGRVHLYRAILEGIAYEQRLVGDAMMAAAGRRFATYIVMGGGSRSELWCQILADVTGVPVVRSTTTEATCLGAAIMAATAVGWYDEMQTAATAMTDSGPRFDPHPENQAIYERLYREVYQPLFPTIRSLVDRLTELTKDA